MHKLHAEILEREGLLSECVNYEMVSRTKWTETKFAVP